MEMTSLAKSF